MSFFEKTFDTWVKEPIPELNASSSLIDFLGIILRKSIIEPSSVMDKDIDAFITVYNHSEFESDLELYTKMVIITNLTVSSKLSWLFVKKTTNPLYVNLNAFDVKTKIKFLVCVFKFFLTAQTLPEFYLLTRKLFKAQFMTYFYNGQNKSRVQYFEEYINEFFVLEGLDKISPHILNSFCWNLNRFFMSKIIELAPDAPKFLKICEQFIKSSSIVIPLNHITWSFFICALSPDIIRKLVPADYLGYLKKHKMKLLEFSNEANLQVMTRTFASIFAQSLDAAIVHGLINKCATLDKLLLEANLPPISFCSNHDSFGICLLYSPLLEPLLKSCYNHLSSCRFGSLLGYPSNCCDKF